MRRTHAPCCGAMDVQPNTVTPETADTVTVLAVEAFTTNHWYPMGVVVERPSDSVLSLRLMMTVVPDVSGTPGCVMGLLYGSCGDTESAIQEDTVRIPFKRFAVESLTEMMIFD